MMSTHRTMTVPRKDSSSPPMRGTCRTNFKNESHQNSSVHALDAPLTLREAHRALLVVSKHSGSSIYESSKRSSIESMRVPPPSRHRGRGCGLGPLARDLRVLSLNSLPNEQRTKSFGSPIERKKTKTRCVSSRNRFRRNSLSEKIPRVSARRADTSMDCSESLEISVINFFPSFLRVHPESLTVRWCPRAG